MSDSALGPPAWARRALLRVLPPDSMRDAILGDLHEEYAQDVAALGLPRARVRHGLRVTGIIAHAVFDSAMGRRWMSTDPQAAAGATASAPAPQVPGPSRDVVVGHGRGLAGYAGFAALAFGVLVVGIVANTMLFSAAQPQGPRVSSAAGVGGVLVLVACVAVGALIMCAGPRWCRKRVRGA